MKGKGEKPFGSSQKQLCAKWKGKGCGVDWMWCTMCFVSGTCHATKIVAKWATATQAVHVCVTAMVKHQRHSGDGDFGLMKEQWSFVFHVSPHPLPHHRCSFYIHHCVVWAFAMAHGLVVVWWCAFWSISTKVEWFHGLKDKHQLCHSHNTHQVQQSHNGPWGDLGQETCAKTSEWFVWVWPWWHALGRKAQPHLHKNTLILVCQSMCHKSILITWAPSWDSFNHHQLFHCPLQKEHDSNLLSFSSLTSFTFLFTLQS